MSPLTHLFVNGFYCRDSRPRFRLQRKNELSPDKLSTSYLLLTVSVSLGMFSLSDHIIF